ncbi:MAG TPA: hypothetical protein VKT75_12365 [Acidobacteriaceae bacterium]|nr:hypothetical protein [Acidobacteriaceae bacterium]
MARSSASRVRSKEQAGSGGGLVQRSASSKGEKASAEQPETSVHPVEPSADDARSAGSNQGKRKVLQMNVRGGQAQQPKGTPAAQHATGSFTGTSGGLGKKG